MAHMCDAMQLRMRCEMCDAMRLSMHLSTVIEHEVHTHGQRCKHTTVINLEMKREHTEKELLLCLLK